jgi:ribosomal-protein-alanine N-acetyltransferase
VTLSTARLTLRELTAADASFVVALMNEPSFIAHIGDRGVRTVADAEHYIARGPWTQYATAGFGLWLVSLQASGEPIGICGLLKREALRAPDLGFAFRPAYWSKGYAFEAGQAVMHFAAAVLGFPRLLAIVSPANHSSVRLLEKLGFRFERLIRMSAGAAEVALYAAPSDTIPPP